MLGVCVDQGNDCGKDHCQDEQLFFPRSCRCRIGGRIGRGGSSALSVTRKADCFGFRGADDQHGGQGDRKGHQPLHVEAGPPSRTFYDCVQQRIDNDAGKPRKGRIEAHGKTVALIEPVVDEEGADVENEERSADALQGAQRVKRRQRRHGSHESRGTAE